MPSKICNICRKVIPSAQYEDHRLAEHGRSSRPSADARKDAFERARYRCEVCGVTKEQLSFSAQKLELHHVDGDWRNNWPDNLQVTCPQHNPRGAGDERFTARAARNG